MKRFEILTVRLRNITPTIIGGYAASSFSSSLNVSEGFRVSELKGVWRRWFRILALGALWDATGHVKREEIKEKVGAVLGSTKASSKFILQAYAKKKGNLRLPEDNVTLPPRLHILKLGKDIDKLHYYDAAELEYVVSLLEQPQRILKEDELRVGVGSLFMALIFQGVGAITNRGFGAWDIQVGGVGREYEEKLSDYIHIIGQLNKVETEGEAEVIVKKYIHLLHGDFLKFMGVQEESKKEIESIPPSPLVSLNPRFFRFKIKNVNANSVMDLLVKIGKATMKASWKAHFGLSQKDPDGQIHTWVLGLPRGQKKKRRDQKEERHGYFVDIEKFELGRRPSAISVRPLKKLSEAKWMCLVYGFLSKDWPKSIYHVSQRFGTRRVEEIPVRTQGKLLRFNIPSEYERFQEAVFNTAFDMVVKCL
jgi:CRISPR type III-B/RAMP module RAMP protein Cmr1